MNDHQQPIGAPQGPANVHVYLTEQEAHNLLNILTQTALPYTVSNPIINKIGQAFANMQNARMAPSTMLGAGLGSCAVRDDGADESDTPQKREHDA